MLPVIVNQVLNLVESNINESLRESLAEGDVDPGQLNRVRAESIALCLGILAFLRFRDTLNLPWQDATLDEAPELFTKGTGSPSLLLTQLPLVDHYQRQRYEDWFSKLRPHSFASLSLSETYEALLAYHGEIVSGRYKVIENKASRNHSGSYYTPQVLADAAVRKTLDGLVLRRLGIEALSFHPNRAVASLHSLLNLFSSIKTIDFACGTGHFLCAVLRYVDTYVLKPGALSATERSNALNRLCQGIWGIDIDLTALELAKYEIALLTQDAQNVQVLSRRFLQGNPLLPYISGPAPEGRRQLADSGFIYHPTLGLPLADLEEEMLDGFDVIVGNPPWEKVRLEERSFFRAFAPHIARTNKKDERIAAIRALASSHPKLYQHYVEFSESLEQAKRLIQENPLLTHAATGELNTNALFTELATQHMKPIGCACLVVKSAVVMTPVHSTLFAYLLKNQYITHVYDFINRRKIFDIDSRERFAVLILGQNPSREFTFLAGLENPTALLEAEGEMTINLPTLKAVNPITRMLPSVNSSAELAFLVSVSSGNVFFGDAYPHCKYGRLVHYTNHADYIITDPANGYLAVYEGKFIEQYDGRYATYQGLSPAAKYGGKASAAVVPDESKANPLCTPQSRYFIEQGKWFQLSRNYPYPYSLMWRSLTSSSNRRTCIATILPHMPASQSVQFLQLPDFHQLAIILSLFNSIVFDYMLRLKLNGIDLTQTVLKQVPVPDSASLRQTIRFRGVEAEINDHLLARVALLLQNDARLWSFCREIHPSSYPDLGHRQVSRKYVMFEIDQLVARAYRMSNEVLAQIARSFPSFYSTKEIEAFQYDTH